MKTLKQFFAVMDMQTAAVTILAIASTYCCTRYKILADIPTNLIGLAVVFPIVFSINAAYKRREEALVCLSSIKANLMGLYYAHRDWLGEGTETSAHVERFTALANKMLAAISSDLSPAGRSAATLEKVYDSFSELSRSHEKLRQCQLGVSEVSRVNQYGCKIMAEFERMRNIARYRTPLALRAYSSVFLNLFPIAFGPYFAFLASESKHFPFVGYLVAVLYSLVLVTLDNLQEHLEDPFDELGVDDVKLADITIHP